MTKPTGFIFLGPPGSGKGTQAQRLAQQLQIPHISTGEMLREAIANATPLGQKAQSYVDQGELVPDELLLDLIRERLQQNDAQKGWILDGFPRNVNQAEFLAQLLTQVDQFDECVISLEVPDQVIIERLLQRGRKDDQEATIRRRLDVYQEQTAPVIEYYRQRDKLHRVNGDQTLDQVSASLTERVMPV